VTAERPTVVHVTTVDSSLEVLLGPTLEGLLRAGYDVVGASAPGPFVESLARRGVRHIALEHATRTMAPVEDARALAELVRLFRRLRPSIVHTHTPKPGIYGRLAARVAGVPVVVNTVHGLYALPGDPWPKRAAVYGLERLAATCSQTELLVNAEDRDTLRRLRVPDERLTVIGNGIDLDRFDLTAIDADDRAAARRELGAVSDDDVVVGLVGRLVREKGYLEMFEAAARLRERHPELRVAVVGPDEPTKADALTADDKRAAEDVGVRFLGERDDVPRLYAAMDIFVLASYREGFPLSPMEAAAMGVPAVVTDIRGCRQVVDDGETGLLVPARDAGALADAVDRLASDPALRRRLGGAGRAKALASFGHQRCVDVVVATYERLLHAAGRTAPSAGPVDALGDAMAP
jgi:glycosyltransferase involved in cell wall biosynthesis